MPVAIYAFVGLTLAVAPLVAAHFADHSTFSIPFFLAPVGMIMMIGGVTIGWIAMKRGINAIRSGLPWAVHSWGFTVAVIVGGVTVTGFFAATFGSLLVRWIARQ